jgi:hypothetical protein
MNTWRSKNLLHSRAMPDLIRQELMQGLKAIVESIATVRNPIYSFNLGSGSGKSTFADLAAIAKSDETPDKAAASLMTLFKTARDTEAAAASTKNNPAFYGEKPPRTHSRQPRRRR